MPYPRKPVTREGAQPIFIQLLDAEGKPEATGTRYNADRQLLPPDTWSVRWQDGKTKTMTVDEMPERWREQIRRWTRFGKTLSD